MAQKKFDVRIIFFRLGRLQTLLLKNHIVREVSPFPMSCHMFVVVILTTYMPGGFNKNCHNYGCNSTRRPQGIVPVIWNPLSSLGRNNKTLCRAQDPRANGALLSKLTE